MSSLAIRPFSFFESDNARRSARWWGPRRRWIGEGAVVTRLFTLGDDPWPILPLTRSDGPVLYDVGERICRCRSRGCGGARALLNTAYPARSCRCGTGAPAVIRALRSAPGRRRSGVPGEGDPPSCCRRAKTTMPPPRRVNVAGAPSVIPSVEPGAKRVFRPGTPEASSVNSDAPLWLYRSVRSSRERHAVRLWRPPSTSVTSPDGDTLIETSISFRRAASEPPVRSVKQTLPSARRRGRS